MESTTHTSGDLPSAAYWKRCVGLLPIVERNMDAINTESDAKEKTRCYLVRSVNGQTKALDAFWADERLVHSRPKYTMNSVVSERLSYDLLKKISQLATTSTAEESFHRTTQIPP
jgi:hypothetical protein